MKKLKVGTKLIAIDECITEDTNEPTLTIGKEYKIKGLNGDEFYIKDDTGEELFFHMQENMHKYFETVKPLTFEVGKSYRTRGGFKATVLKNDMKSLYPMLGFCDVKGNDITVKWASNGLFLPGHNHEYDLISEWVEPLDFNWDCLPAWADEYIAMEKSGYWWGYSTNPKIINGYVWDNTGGMATNIPKDYEPKNFNGDWKESLIKNPNK